MTALDPIEEKLDDSGEIEAMPLFEYEVVGQNQQAMRLVTYASNQDQAFGQVARAIQQGPGGSRTDLGDILLVARHTNSTVVQVSGTVTVL